MTVALKLKPSVFNVQVRHNGKHLAFNSLVACSIAMDDPQARLFNDALDEIRRRGSIDDKSLLRCLYALGFVVRADEDELIREQARFKSVREDTETLRLTIAPTMACNLHCSYCFQQDFAGRRTMRLDVQRGVVEFVRRKTEGAKALVVQWFGGEPLLRYKQIVAMTEAFQRICAERGMRYHAEIMTNGMLLTPEIIASLAKLFGQSHPNSVGRRCGDIRAAQRSFHGARLGVPRFPSRAHAVVGRCDRQRDDQNQCRSRQRLGWL